MCARARAGEWRTVARRPGRVCAVCVGVGARTHGAHGGPSCGAGPGQQSAYCRVLSASCGGPMGCSSLGSRMRQERPAPASQASQQSGQVLMRRRDAQRRTQQQRDQGTAALAGGAKVHTQGGTQCGPRLPVALHAVQYSRIRLAGRHPIGGSTLRRSRGSTALRRRGSPPVSVCMPSESDLSGGGPAVPAAYAATRQCATGPLCQRVRFLRWKLPQSSIRVAIFGRSSYGSLPQRKLHSKLWHTLRCSFRCSKLP